MLFKNDPISQFICKLSDHFILLSMVRERRSFEMFYKLYSQIRFTCKLPIFFKWFLHLVFFIQFVIVSLDDTNIKDILNEETFTILRHVHFTVIFYPWMFATQSFLFDSFCFLLFDIFFIVELIFLAKKANAGKNISPLQLYYCQIMHEFIVPIFCFGLAYRIARQTYSLTVEFNIYELISLIFYVIDLSMSLFFIYMNSIFLEPCDFTIRSNLDVYDGKYTWLVHFAKISVCMLMYLIPLLNDLVFLLLIALMIVCIFIIYYLRIFNFIHVHFFGQMFEITPFAAAPFILLIHRYITTDQISLLFAELGLILIFALLIYLNVRILSKHSVEVFRNFTLIVEENNQIRSLPGNLAAIIRIVAVQSGDPKPIERFIDAQKHLTLRTSQLIEIVRFLGIIPDKRKRMIKELEQCQTRSVFHKFQIHYFLLVLNGLEKPPDEIYLKRAHDYYSNCIIQYTKFWYYKINKQPFRSYGSAIKLTYAYFDAYFGIEALIHRFPYSADLRLLYSEFLMNSCGKVKESFWSRKIGMILKNEKCYTRDILFKKITKSYPLVRQYTSGIYKNYTESNDYSTKIINLDEYECKFGEESKTIASHIRRSRGMSPCVTTFNVIFATLCIFIFVGSALGRLGELENLFDQLIENFEKIRDSFFNIISGSLMIISVRYGQSDISKDNTELFCKEAFLESTFNSLNYFVRGIPLANTTNGIFVGTIFRYINSFPTPEAGESYCPAYFNITHEHFLNSSLLKSSLLIDDQTNIINNIKSNVKQYYRVYNHIESTAVLAISLLVVQYFILVLYFYKKNGNIPKEALEFLISKKRLALLLSHKSIDSWKLLKPYIEESQSNFESLGADSKSSNDIISDEESDEIIGQAMENLKKSNGIFTVVCCGSLASWFVAIFAFVIAFIPIYFNSIEIFSRLDQIPPIVPTINAINNIWYLFSQVINLTDQNYDLWLENLAINHDIIINSNDEFYNEYNREICCIRNHEPPTISGYDLIESILNLSFVPTKEQFALVVFPFFIRFSDELVSNGIRNVLSDSLPQPVSSSASIILLLIIVFVLFMIAGIFIDKIAGLAYDSLFHFPYEYFADTKTFSPIINQSLIPGIITITTIADTDEIYLTSDNTEQILGRKPYDFISRRFNETFVPLDNGLRMYTDQDGKTKIFNCQIINSDVINKAILVESNQKSGGLNEDEALSKLSRLIPQSYATAYLETGQRHFDVPHTFLIQLQLDLSHCKAATLCKQVTDMPAMYSHCSFVSTYGDRLYMIAGTEDARIIALILRDILEGAQKLSVNGRGPLLNAIAVNTDIEIQIHTDGCPYLSVNCQELSGIIRLSGTERAVLIDRPIAGLEAQPVNFSGLLFYRYEFAQIRDQLVSAF